jgi:hypothetical protein
LEPEGPNGVPTPMPTFNPENLIDRTFLLDPETDGLCFRARVKQIAYELEEDNEKGQIDRIKAFIQIDKGDKMVEEIITNSSILDYIQKDETDEDNPNKTWRFCSITAHQGPLLPNDPDYNGSSYNVQVE